jgi:hypothetical protein
MRPDGHDLETLVARIERLHLPEGTDVKVNSKRYDEDGIHR